MVRRLLLIGLFVLAGAAVQAQQKKIKLLRAPSAITVDGLIDDAWSAADSAAGFTQQQPFHGKPSVYLTVAKVLTTDDAFYCLIIARDSSSHVQVKTGTQDDTEGDFVSVMLDTYGDRRTAYKFGVNAAGAKSDCRLLDDGRNRDYSWDGVWYAAAKVYAWGWTAEMMIPYKFISYDKSLRTWGIDFDRWNPRITEDSYWNRYEENEGQRISKFGALTLDGFTPTVTGHNLEIYPVGLAEYVKEKSTAGKVTPHAGIDVFYNPSTSLTYQLTVNPDFAQIEADPYAFNIGRYESYFDERRPFFTQGNEIFMASGRDRNSGFYRPLELFYSRRIGKKNPDGSEVPLIAGTKAFGRFNESEYGAFLAVTNEKAFMDDTLPSVEPRAYFGAVRYKKQIFGNSTIGAMAVGKFTAATSDGVVDIDGAFRGTEWQYSYQMARSFKNNDGDYAFASGLNWTSKNWMLLCRNRYIGERFDIDQVGYVPWKGTGEVTTVGGPRWVYDEGPLRALLLYTGLALNYERLDAYTDHAAFIGFNLQFRANWGMETSFNYGKSRDNGLLYNYYEFDHSMWTSQSTWDANLWGGFARTYNFSREYEAPYFWAGNSFTWKGFDAVSFGGTMNVWTEYKPSGAVEDVTVSARPFVSLLPINYLTLRVYVDNLYLRSTDKLEHVLLGFLFSYNYSPKSWIYFAYNEDQERMEDPVSKATRLDVRSRAATVKIKYLYYF
jgi:hypothetical protein